MDGAPAARLWGRSGPDLQNQPVGLMLLGALAEQALALAGLLMYRY